MRSSNQHFTLGRLRCYAQLASVLRSRIVSGEWANGTALPSIEELCSCYSLGRVTVRQALSILAKEGLLSSQRGRLTHVTHMSAGVPSAPLFMSLASPQTQAPHYSVQLLSRDNVQELPPARWQVGSSKGPYVYLRKLDKEAGQSYGLSSVYLLEDVYKRFPKGAEESAKIAQLLLKYARRRISKARERLTVQPVDFEAATALGYPMAAPAARAERVFCDKSDRVIMYSVSIYRGDRFGMERDLMDFLRSED